MSLASVLKIQNMQATSSEPFEHLDHMEEGDHSSAHKTRAAGTLLQANH